MYYGITFSLKLKYNVLEFLLKGFLAFWNSVYIGSVSMIM